MSFIFDPSLVLYLPLYELDGSSLMSKDKYGHLCTVTGASWRPSSRCFDGVDDKINCGTSPALDFAGGDFSLEAWFCPMLADGVARRIINKHKNMGSGQVGYALYFTQPGSVVFSVINNGMFYNTAVSGVVTNRWTHVMATRQGAVSAVYVDGQRYQGTGTAASITNDAYLAIGSNSSAGEFFTGYIGEVRIYCRLLSAQEAQHNYLATKWRYR